MQMPKRQLRDDSIFAFFFVKSLLLNRRTGNKLLMCIYTMMLIILGPVLAVLVGSLISPFSYLHFAFTGPIYYVIQRMVGARRAFVSIWVGTILVWVFVLTQYVWFDSFFIGPSVSSRAFEGNAMSGLASTFFVSYALFISLATLMSRRLEPVVFKKIKGGYPFVYVISLFGLVLMLVGLFNWVVSSY